MGMRLTTCRFAILTLTVFFHSHGCGIASGQEHTADYMKQWLISEHDRLAAYRIPKNVKVSIDSFGLPATDDQLARWREAVVGKPEHPYRQRLEAHERRRRNGPDRGRCVFWYYSDSKWRYNVDVPYLPDRYIDYGVNGNASWVLTGDRASYFELGIKTAEVPPQEKLTQVMDDFHMIAHWGRLPRMIPNPRECTLNSEVNATGGRLDVITQNSWRVQFELDWLPESRAYRLKRTMVFPPGRDAPTIQYEFLESRYDDLLGISIPTRLIHTLGFEQSDVTFIASERIDPDAIGRLLDTPEPKSTDVIRGEVNIRLVSDYRPGKNVMRVLGGEEPRVMPLPPQPISQSNRFRALGWIAAIVILLGIVTIRVRRIVRSRRQQQSIKKGAVQ